MTQTNQPDPIVVEARDRNAAADLIAAKGRRNSSPIMAVREGHNDGHFAVQAFAKYRQSIRTTDAARIAALEASLSHIAKQWPDSFAAKHARATLRRSPDD